MRWHLAVCRAVEHAQARRSGNRGGIRVGEAPYLAGKLDGGSIEVEAKQDGGTASSEVGYGGRKPS